MQIKSTSADRRFAAEIYRRYKAKPGSEHIASYNALTSLSALLRAHRPRVVLECGAGIGTITEALLSHPCDVKRVIATEHNAFCLAALANNLRHHDPGRVTIISDVGHLSSVPIVADLIVGDASRGRQNVFRFARAGTVVFVEGNRRGFRDDFRQFLAAQHLGVAFREYGPRGEYWFPHLRRALRDLLRLPKAPKGCWIGQVRAA